MCTLAVALVFFGDPASPRFVSSGTHPDGLGRCMQLAEMGYVALLRFILSCV
jgi:hypothetical protein